MKLVRTNTPWNSMGRFLASSEPMSLFTRLFDESIDFPRVDFAPAVDVIENETSYILKAELPGIKKEDIKLEMKDNTLIMTGERNFDKEEKRDNYHRIERSYGSFTRSFLLPNNVSVDKLENIDAKLTDGVLVVTLPKRQEKQPQGIKIQ